MMMRHVTALQLAAGVGLSESACSKPSAGGKQHAGTRADPFVIGMSQCNLGEPWRAQMNEDVRRAAEKHGNVEVVVEDVQNDSLPQRTQVAELLDPKIDLLIISFDADMQ